KNNPSYTDDYKGLNLKSNVRKILYNALIDKERMDEAWDYKMMHEATYYYYDGEYEKREDYLEYMSDVVKKYCSHGKKNEARQFVSSHIDWFRANVENSTLDLYTYDDKIVQKIKKEWGTANVRRQLIEIINNY
ncbi:MAG: hypothetical protein IKH10_01350, partial [Bacteroidetes bacterium]|nr:hypothetical protein [Bacteroidota bacterium]